MLRSCLKSQETFLTSNKNSQNSISYEVNESSMVTSNFECTDKIISLELQILNRSPTKKMKNVWISTENTEVN